MIGCTRGSDTRRHIGVIRLLFHAQRAITRSGPITQGRASDWPLSTQTGVFDVPRRTSPMWSCPEVDRPSVQLALHLPDRLEREQWAGQNLGTTSHAQLRF